LINWWSAPALSGPTRTTSSRPSPQRTIEPERHRTARPHGEQEPNGATLESSSCEVEDSGCGEVEPLNVIDSDQNRPRHGKLRQHCDGRGRNGPLTGNRIGAASLQKCYLERIALRAAVAVQVAVDALAEDGGLADRAQAGQRQLEQVDRVRRELSEREQKVLADVATSRNEHTTTEVLVAQAVERMQVASDNVATTLREYREHVEEAREMLERARLEVAADAAAFGMEGEEVDEDAEDGIEISALDIDTNEDVELAPDERNRIAALVAKLQRRLDVMGPIKSAGRARVRRAEGALRRAHGAAQGPRGSRARARPAHQGSRRDAGRALQRYVCLCVSALRGVNCCALPRRHRSSQAGRGRGAKRGGSRGSCCCIG